MTAILDTMQTKIRYRSVRMSELIEETASESAFAGNIFLKGVLSGIREGIQINDAWNDTVDTAPFFSPSDREILKNIGSGLGSSDTQGQLSLLALGADMIGRALRDAESECAGRSRMIMSVWTLCGIGAGIIII